MRLFNSLICSIGISACGIAAAQDTFQESTAGISSDSNLLSSSMELPTIGEGVITGMLTDSATGKHLGGVSVSVTEPYLYTTTDPNGMYLIEAVPEGSRRISFYLDGFDYGAIPDATVHPDEITRVDFALSPREAAAEVEGDIIRLDALIITADVIEGSELGLIRERQKAASISDSISSDTFSRLTLSDAASAMSKVTGASVVDGKYVFIRGLGDRYSNTLLDGVAIPSADPDRRAVQMDQFPTAVLESIVTSKSFTPDQPGAFAGGSVNIRTKNFPDQFTLSAGSSIEYNTNATGKKVLTVPGGGRDWMAMDDGTRALQNVPTAIPTSLIPTAVRRDYTPREEYDGRTPAEELDRITKEFHNSSFFPELKEARPNFGFDFTLADLIDLKGEQALGYIFSLTYDSSVSHYENGIVGRYTDATSDPTLESFIDPKRIFTTDINAYSFRGFLDDPANFPEGRPEPAFGVTSTSQNVDWGLYGQVAYRFSPNHEASLRLFHNQSAEDRVRRGIGEAVRSDNGSEYREAYDLLYTERGISSAQLSGSSIFDSLNDVQVEWRLSHAVSTQDQPDYRSFEFKWRFDLQEYNPSGIVQNRFFRELEDTSTEGAIDITIPFKVGENSWSVKTGGLISTGERENSERRFQINGVQINDFGDIQVYPQPAGIVSGGVGAGINGTNTPYVFGAWMQEIGSIANYDGEQSIRAGYIMLDASLNDKWRIIGGARLENTDLTTTPASSNSRVGEIQEADLLPAIQVVYSLNDSMNLRGSYGKTIARPTYWELADVKIYDAFLDEFKQGNPDLQMTTINNFDLRWEWFPTPRETVAISAFYKTLDSPIEVLIRGDSLTPDNIEEAKVYGLEFEARQYLGRFSEVLENTSIGINAAWIHSEATIPEDELESIRSVFPDAGDTRELFGQSPYTFNLDLSHEVIRWGSRFTLVFNIVGKRLDAVVPGPVPDVYEQPSPLLDFIYSQRLRNGWKLKLSAKNIFNSNKDKLIRHNGMDYVYERYKVGTTYSIGLSYDF